MGDDNVTAWALRLNKDNDGHCLFDCRKRLLQDLWETAKAFISSIIHSHFGFCCFYSLLPFCYWLSLLSHLLHPLSHAYISIIPLSGKPSSSSLLIHTWWKKRKEKVQNILRACDVMYLLIRAIHEDYWPWELWPIYHVKMAFGLQKRREKERKKLD